MNVLIMPPFLSIADIQARMRMTENAIFEAVDESRDFRVVNLAATVTVDNNPQDRLAVEHFTVNRIYGCMIDRGSKVTIVSLSNIVDPVIGHFAYYMAKIGGFNYISRETGETRPYRSFFTYSATSPLPGQQEFMKDIETLSAKEGSWVITMLAASGANEPEYPTQIHFCYGGAKGDEGFGAPDARSRHPRCGQADGSNRDRTQRAIRHLLRQTEIPQVGQARNICPPPEKQGLGQQSDYPGRLEHNLLQSPAHGHLADHCGRDSPRRRAG